MPKRKLDTYTVSLHRVFDADGFFDAADQFWAFVSTPGKRNVWVEDVATGRLMHIEEKS